MVWALLDAVFTIDELCTSNFGGGQSKNTNGPQKKALNKEKLNAIEG